MVFSILHSTLKILHLSDVHAGPYIRNGYIKRVVDISNTLEPDLAVITGDFTETEFNDIIWSSDILGDELLIKSYK